MAKKSVLERYGQIMKEKDSIYERYFPNKELTRYAFISYMEAYIKQLLTDPVHEKVDDYLVERGITNEKALKMLLTRFDPNDERSAILIRTERIKPEELSDEEIASDKKPKDKFFVKYKLPRKDYLKKMRNLYISLFEAHIVNDNSLNEMNANELDSKVQVKRCDDKVQYSFGKNGWGISDELIKIGKDIKKLSKDNNVYIDDVFIDSADDVYDITVGIHPIEEGAWGYDTLENDMALDYQDKFGERCLMILTNDVLRSNGNDLWAKLGVLIDFLKKYKEDEIRFTDEYANAINIAQQNLTKLYNDKEFISTWSEPNEIQSSLKKIYKDIASLKYEKEVMPINQEPQGPLNPDMTMESINEDGEGAGGTMADMGGATNESSSGQYVTPLFGKPIKRKTMYITSEQAKYIKKALNEDSPNVMNTQAGDFGYDAPGLNVEDDPTLDHENMMEKSWEEGK